MARALCPLPEIEAALAPYINSRQETQRIRQSIARYLSTLSEGVQVDDPLLKCAAPIISLGEATSSLEGLYKRYYDALRANIVARQSYQQVKQELEELKAESGQDPARQGRPSDVSSVQGYINLQRQRQQHAKLNIVQDALASLTEDAPRTLHDDLGTVVKDEVGKATDAPKSSLSSAETSQQLRELVFRLKRELLLTKHAAETKTAKSAQNGHVIGSSIDRASTTAQVEALRAARSQLVAWIEGELAKISEGEGDSLIMDADASGIAEEESRASSQAGFEAMQQQIKSRYDDYVRARQMLVQNIDAALAVSRNQVSSNTVARSGTTLAPGIAKPASSPQDKITYTDLVTTVPALVQAAQAERALLQQASYLRRQLNAASDETKAVAQRLAGESYLVSPDATSMGAWATAAAVKSDDTVAFTKDQVMAGNACLDATMERLSRLETRHKALRSLRGDL